SMERAESVAAFLRNDADAWLAAYGDDRPEERRWGTAEDAIMLAEILRRSDENLNGEPLHYFQRSRRLPESDGIDDVTRRALVEEYMGLDGISVPGTMS